jgi:SPP1 family predicted phage head-tail adaptor
MTCTPPFKVGELNHLCVIQQKDKVDDGAGGQDTTWNERVQIWCKVRPMNGREERRYEQLNAVATTVFETWWNAAVLEEDRLVFNGVTYNIRYKENIYEKNRWMKLVCERGVIN